MDLRKFTLPTIVGALVSLIIPGALATSYTVITNSIMGKSPFGLLVDLHLQDFFPAEQAVMYYNYIAVFAIVLWAAFASQSNESRFAFTTPFLAAFFVFIGWLNAGTNAASYWGTIMMCVIFGAFMYVNDMNHEKYGIAGPGDKLFAIAFMIMCFTASFGFVTSSQFDYIFNAAPTTGNTQNVMCGSAYTCDSSGNIALDVSVTQVNNVGGFGSNILSDIYILTQVAISMLKMAIVVVGSILFISVVVLAAYPALAASPQTVAFLVIMNVVIWAIYFAAFFRWMYKPGPGEGQI